ncbi:MAG: hypothetical protein K2X44_09030, partial [Magnetospirillum sp.]|nr:hypothetical protein [Magnetospirillum sp.]
IPNCIGFDIDALSSQVKSIRREYHSTEYASEGNSVPAGALFEILPLGAVIDHRWEVLDILSAHGWPGAANACEAASPFHHMAAQKLDEPLADVLRHLALLPAALGAWGRKTNCKWAQDVAGIQVPNNPRDYVEWRREQGMLLAAIAAEVDLRWPGMTDAKLGKLIPNKKGCEVSEDGQRKQGQRLRGKT